MLMLGLLIGILVYFLATDKNLMLYPQLKGENIELFAVRSEENMVVIQKILSNKDSPFINVIFTDGDEEVHRIISIDKLDLEQKTCNKKWDCPVMTLPKDIFVKKILKKKINDPFDADITREVK